MATYIKRNPLIILTTAIVAIAALAFAWWTISPLFIRTNLVEGQAVTLPAASSDMESSGGQAMPKDGLTVLASGSFDRKDDVHYANGKAILARQEDGSIVVRLQDLDAANGPDLYVLVSEHPNPQSGVELHQGEHNLGRLKATNGSFNYVLNPSIDVSKIKSVVIYC
ncbi:MAG TPA: DM13 domain-containing protein [Chloroflexia bacterium]|nr:DM13 domain-containing protein [Chloroflexia bacterium]